ncbi:MAG: hypothetical protein ACP5HM_07690 [Anaerolineae bacterium]
MKSRGLLLLGMTLLVTALVIAIISGLITPTMLQRGGDVAASLSAPDVANGQSAREAFAQILAWSATQNLQFELLSLSTTLRRDAQSQSWTFQLYRPENRQLTIVVADGTEVHVLRQLTALYPQKPLATDAWVTDSDEVLQMWWERSGKATWSQPEAHTLTLHLGRDATGAPVWTLTVLDEGNHVLDVFQMHGESGAILPTPGGEP